MHVSIPEIADMLIERSQNSSWVVSFKALITIHHLMSYGNEVNRFFENLLNLFFSLKRFEAYMASHNHHLQSAMFVDRLGMPGGDMSGYIRRYSNYLNEKREAYKLMGYDLCKIKRGLGKRFRLNSMRFFIDLFSRKEDGYLRTMPIDKVGDSINRFLKYSSFSY
jgi:hypothetical protein